MSTSMIARDPGTAAAGNGHTIDCDQPVAARDEGAPGIRIEAFQSRLDCMWQKPVIGIEKQKVATGAFAHAPVARPGKALIVLSDIAGSRITIDNFGGIIGRTIVDHHNLEILNRLRNDTLNRLAKELRMIVAGNDDRNQGNASRINVLTL